MIEFALEKKESGPYWKRLVKEGTKQHWLKVDFNKWKDEDESDDEAGGGEQDLEQVSPGQHFEITAFEKTNMMHRPNGTH